MRIAGVLETCLYVDDLEGAERFYGRILGLQLFAKDPERHLFFRCGDGMLLLFDPAQTRSTVTRVGGEIVPLHGAEGAGHVAFRVPADEISAWRARLEEAGVAIESEVPWPRGGSSIYFRDPAGNSLELAPAGIWGIREAD